MPARPRVLLADDCPDLVKALEQVVSPECDVVATFSDGSQVAGAAARLQPVVTVVDLNMPNVGGLDVCREIRRVNPRAKVILISITIDDEMRAEALAAGASACVAKRMAATELGDAIRAAWADLP